jgi:hypothetical protein
MPRTPPCLHDRRRGHSVFERHAHVADIAPASALMVKPEDIEATIYSALGIDWTTVRHDDPLNRGFEYVPTNEPYVFAPINELWD